MSAEEDVSVTDPSAESAEVFEGDNTAGLGCVPPSHYVPTPYGEVVPQSYDIQVIAHLLTDDVMKNLDADQIRMARSAVTTYLGQFKAL